MQIVVFSVAKADPAGGYPDIDIRYRGSGPYHIELFAPDIQGSWDKEHGGRFAVFDEHIWRGRGALDGLWDIQE